MANFSFLIVFLRWPYYTAEKETKSSDINVTIKKSRANLLSVILFRLVTQEEIDEIFNPVYYTKRVDEIFERIGLGD